MSTAAMGAGVHTAKARPSWLARTFACVSWLRGYQPAWLRADLVAGITLAAYLLPSGIGDASLAYLPPEAGLYACLFSGLVFWVFCSSRRTVVTVTSAISILIGASLGPIANGDSTRFGALAACTAILVAAIALVAWAVRAGGVVRFISETVLAGFKTGVAFYLASSQIPKLLGIKGGHGSFWERSWTIVEHIRETNMTSVLVGGTALALLIAGKMFLKNKPVAIVVVVGGVLAGSWLGLGERGVKMLGEVPQGLPALSLPSIAPSAAEPVAGGSEANSTAAVQEPAASGPQAKSTADILNELLPLALACFLLGAVETAAIGRMFAAKHGERFDANQELLALAAGNLATGLGHAFPVSGGMSQSLVNESGGAKTPASGLVAAAIILIVAVFFSKMLETLPQPVLAAIVLMAVASLVKVDVFKRLWKTDRAELIIAAAALLGVLGSGLLRGVLIGVVISLLLLIRAASRPAVSFLGRIPGNRRYSDLARHPDNEPVPGVLIVRPEGAVLYFNTEHIDDRIMDRVEAEFPKLVILDLSAAPRIDLAGAEWVRELGERLHNRGIKLRPVDARSSVRDKLRVERVEDVVGRIDRFTSVADAVDAYQAGDAVVQTANA